MWQVVHYVVETRLEANDVARVVQVDLKSEYTYIVKV